jgi:ADP-ribose pyrophosphatase YjhB (NUDIX family)
MSLPFSESYLGRIRAIVGKRPLIMPAFRTIVENDRGEILLCFRTDFKLWGLPAGYPELEESIQDCIRREVSEEAGVKLGSFAPYGYASHPSTEVVTYPNGDQVHSFCLLTYSREFSGTPAPNDHEMSEVRFFAYSEIPENLLEHERECIHAFERFKVSGAFQWL